MKSEKLVLVCGAQLQFESEDSVKWKFQCFTVSVNKVSTVVKILVSDSII